MTSLNTFVYNDERSPGTPCRGRLCRKDDYLKVSARIEMISSRIFKPLPGPDLAVTLRRRSGRECRYPDYREVIITSHPRPRDTGMGKLSLILTK
jgi:hypothetical protein